MNGAEITISEGCVLDFQGGSFSNGNIRFNNTYLLGNPKFDTDFIGIILNNYICIDWLGAIPNKNNDCTKYFNRFTNYIYNTYIAQQNNTIGICRNLYLSPGTYNVTSIEIQSDVTIEGSGKYTTVIKSISNCEKGVINITHNNTTLKNLTIDGGLKENYSNIGCYIYGNNGQYSIIDNVRFINCDIHSLIVEDTNIVTLTRCQFNSGKEGYVLCDGADDIIINGCGFEAQPDYDIESPYFLKFITEKTTNKTANSGIVCNCWFETNYQNCPKIDIYVDAYNILIDNNHFHTIKDAIKNYVCYIGDNTDCIKFNNNNIQATANNELVLGVSENAGYIYASNNRGLHNRDNVEINNNKFKIIFANRDIYESEHVKYEPKGINIQTDVNLNNQFTTPFRYNNMYIWYDANYIVRIKFSAPDNLYDGIPIGTYIRNGDSTNYPDLTNTQKGYCYSENGILNIWNGEKWIRQYDGVGKDNSTYGLLSKRPEINNVRIGFIFMSNQTNFSFPMFSDGNKYICADGFNADYLRKGSSSARPTLTNSDNGFQYFDTSLNKPIWWNGTRWIDPSRNTWALIE